MADEDTRDKKGGVQMKKRGFVVMLLLLLVVSSVAFAERTHFNLEIPTGTGTPLMDWAPVTQPCSHIYFRHYLYDDVGGIFTNYVWVGLNGSNTKLSGTWVRPDTGCYIRPSLLNAARTYRVGITLNTDYGLESIRITGYAEPQH